MKKLTLLLAAGIGYVLGTRAGRERYEQIKAMAIKVKDDPRVQEKANEAAHFAKEQASAAGSKVSDKVGGSSSEDLESQLHPDSTARQDNPYPQGDLP